MIRLTLILVTTLILLTGCAPEEAPAEPTPDLQEQIQARIDMGDWLINSRYITEMSRKAAEAIIMAFEDADGEDASEAVEAIINHFNKSDGLFPRLKTIQVLLVGERNRLLSSPIKDVRIFTSLDKCNSLTEKLLDLLATTPTSLEEFQKNYTNTSDQLDSLYKVLKTEFPESDDDLVAKMSQDNLDYMADLKEIKNVPTPQPKTTPTPDMNLPSPTPTLPVPQTWIDDQGVMHMGHHPPENANIQIVKDKLSIGEATKKEASEDSGKPSSASTIWVDEDGVTHMGSDAPEGVETRSPSDIKLMIE